MLTRYVAVIVLVCYLTIPSHGQPIRFSEKDDGTIVRVSGRSYVIFGGAHFLIPSRDSVFFAARGKSMNIAMLEHNVTASIPRDTTLLREKDSPEVFIMKGGKKSLVPPMTLDLCFAGTYVNVVPAGGLSHIPRGDTIADLGRLPQSAFDTLKTAMAFRMKLGIRDELSRPENRNLQTLGIRRLKRVESLLDQSYGHMTGVGFGLRPYRPIGMIRKPIQVKQSVALQRYSSGPNPQLRGFADIHTHQFANLGFGGQLVAGSPELPLAYDSCSMTSATYNQLVADIWEGCTDACSVIPLPPARVLCVNVCYGIVKIPLDMLLNQVVTRYPHGIDGAGADIGQIALHFSYPESIWKKIYGILNGTHGTEGPPSFHEWPSWKNPLHQGVHKDWLYTAYQRGMRLMVTYAVDNEHLTKEEQNLGHRNKYDADDMNSAYRQIDSAKKLEAFVAQNENGWYKIVRSGEEAEQAIRDGKLAVILGIEVSNFLRCESPDNCTYADIKDRLDSLYEMGVRAFFLIHENDNEFGGTGWFQEREGEEMDIPILNIKPWVQRVRDVETDAKFQDHPILNGRRNATGLTDKGRFLVELLMQKGMIIEVEHLSIKARSQVLALAARAKYPGIVASHAGFFDIDFLGERHERRLSRGDLDTINMLGGMIGLATNQGENRSVVSNPDAIPHNCGWSTETFAQAYTYAIKYSPADKGIALATDFNGGPIFQLGPRFGNDACKGGGSSNHDSLKYPFTSLFDSQSCGMTQIGDKVYNFNRDGLSHVGMLPDLIADLSNLQFTPAQIERIFKSAGEYARMWKNAGAYNSLITYFQNVTSAIFVKEVSDQARSWRILRGKKCLMTSGPVSALIIPNGVLPLLPDENCGQ